MKTTPLRSSGLTGVVPLSAANNNNGMMMKPNYVDALSPIASSPRNSFKLPPQVSLITRIEQPEITPEQPEGNSSWTSSLFSPLLKLFSQDSSNLSDDSTDTNSESKINDEEVLETKSNNENDVNDDFDVDEDDRMEDEVGFYEFDPFIFMAQLPPHHLVRHNVQDARPLPKLHDSSKPTLILDLDETLVHCCADANSSYDVTFGVHFNGSLCQVYVKKRPHLETFLETVSAKFEIVVFTASQRVYAERLLDILDPHGKFIQHRLYRESCLMVAGNLLKDLTILDRDLRRTIIVDNSPHAFGYQLDNGVPIESWYDDPHDVELLKLLPLLEQLHQVNDVRPHLRKVFRMQDLVHEARLRC
jgi:CTD small phosphatase-like protein 2